MKRFTTTALALALMGGTALAQTAQQSTAQDASKNKMVDAGRSDTGDPLAKADPDMKHVIDVLKAMHPKPLPALTAAEARQQPGAADAANQVLREQGKSTLPDPSIVTKNILIDGAHGKIVATAFKPADATGPLPVIVYFHGGGFVIANNGTYAASCELLAKNVNAVVIEPEYAKAPEHKFPAAHEDAVAAYKWVVDHAATLGGDPKTIALVGESAGGNLTVDTAVAVRDQNLQKPVAEVIIYPMAGTNLDTDSYKMAASGSLLPLNKLAMAWIYKQLTRTPADMKDPRLDIVGAADLHGLAPATVITDEIDPLRSEGVALAAKLKQAGVEVDAHDYQGVTHEFFGMGKVVAKAKDAEDVAVANLKKAFGSH